MYKESLSPARDDETRIYQVKHHYFAFSKDALSHYAVEQLMFGRRDCIVI